jgi:hypothetical protein
MVDRKNAGTGIVHVGALEIVANPQDPGFEEIS